MDAKRFAQIAQELPDLLDQQMKTVVGRNGDSLSETERAAYEERKMKISELHKELDTLRKAK